MLLQIEVHHQIQFEEVPCEYDCHPETKLRSGFQKLNGKFTFNLFEIQAS